jgi:hypothetical protein
MVNCSVSESIREEILRVPFCLVIADTTDIINAEK